MCCPGHQLIADGWSVLPLCWTDEAGDCACRRQHGPKSAGTAPRTPHGVKDATTDVAQVDIWSTWWPHANWGIACTGVTVVDIDDTDLAALLKEDEELKQNHCMVSAPRRNGLHIYLKEDDPVQASRVLFSQDGDAWARFNGQVDTWSALAPESVVDITGPSPIMPRAQSKTLRTG